MRGKKAFTLLIAGLLAALLLPCSAGASDYFSTQSPQLEMSYSLPAHISELLEKRNITSSDAASYTNACLKNVKVGDGQTAVGMLNGTFIRNMFMVSIPKGNPMTDEGSKADATAGDNSQKLDKISNLFAEINLSLFGDTPLSLTFKAGAQYTGAFTSGASAKEQPSQGFHFSSSFIHSDPAGPSVFLKQNVPTLFKEKKPVLDPGASNNLKNLIMNCTEPFFVTLDDDWGLSGTQTTGDATAQTGVVGTAEQVKGQLNTDQQDYSMNLMDLKSLRVWASEQMSDGERYKSNRGSGLYKIKPLSGTELNGEQATRFASIYSFPEFIGDTSDAQSSSWRFTDDKGVVLPVRYANDNLYWMDTESNTEKNLVLPTDAYPVYAGDNTATFYLTADKKTSAYAYYDGLEEDGAMPVPAAPSLAGFDFVKWAPVVPPSVPAGDSCYVAVWWDHADEPENTPPENRAGIEIIYYGDRDKSAVLYTDQLYDVQNAPSGKAVYQLASGAEPEGPSMLPSARFQSWQYYDRDGGALTVVSSRNDSLLIFASQDNAGATPAVPAYALPLGIPLYKAEFLNAAGGVFRRFEGLAEGDAIPLPSSYPEKDGHQFVRWNPSVTKKMPAENVKFEPVWKRLVSILTYSVDGNKRNAAVTIGDIITKPADPVKTGYTFAGWDRDFPFSMPDVDVTVTALFTVNSYNFTTVVDGDETTTAYDFGAAITPPDDPVKTGHTFTGWSPAVPAAMPAGNVTVTAQFAVNSYDLITVADGVETATAYDYGAAITPPADPVKTGHTFTGWSPAVPAAMPAENVTVTAQFAVNSYNFTTVVDGIETTTAYDYGAAITPPDDPRKTGYTFTGWSPAVPATMPAGDMTVTAQFGLGQYRFIVVVDGVSTATAYDYNETVAPPADPVKTGHTFTGWIPAVPAAMPDHDMTVTAQFSVNSYDFTTVVDGEQTTAAYDYGATIVPPADPVKTGHTFTGWTPAVPATMPDHAVTVTAEFAVNSYNFITIADGEQTTTAYDYGAEITPPDDPVKTGHAFTGWSPAVPAAMPAENVTVTAQFSVNSYTLTFVVGDETSEFPFAYDAQITGAPVLPEREGFDGAWEPAVPEKMPAQDMTVTATYTPKDYTVRVYFWYPASDFPEAEPSVLTFAFGEAIVIAPPAGYVIDMIEEPASMPQTMPAGNIDVVIRLISDIDT